MKHLAFTGTEYALCGATVREGNSTVVMTEATCPDCVEFIKREEKVNRTMHRHGLKPDYEDKP